MNVLLNTRLWIVPRIRLAQILATRIGCVGTGYALSPRLSGRHERIMFNEDNCIKFFFDIVEGAICVIGRE